MEREYMDYHKEYFNTKEERDERIIELIEEGCRIEKEEFELVPKGDWLYLFVIGVYVSAEEYIQPLII